MATYYTLLTKIGQASVANAVALNQKVNLTYMAVGDGNGNPTTPNENQTALVREKYRAQINQLTVDADNPNYIIAEMVVPTTVGGWSIYEVGVFNDQGQLVAVANFPATYKPELAEGSGRDLIVRIVIQVSNTSVVTLKVDPAITLASQAWVAANYVKKITVAGGTTGQVLVKNSNANEDFKWVDPTAAVDVNVFSREETQTLAANQTIVNLAQLTTDGAALYVEGVRLRDNQFTVNTETRLTLATAYPAGTRVTIVQNEETSRNAFMLKANNLADLPDKAAALVNLGLGDGKGRLINVQMITATGTYTPTTGTKFIIAELIGGGGGGGGAPTTVANQTASGGGGGGGGYVRKLITSGFSGQAVTIGNGGLGATGGTASGDPGGNTTFMGMVAGGGGGGGPGNPVTVAALNGLGGNPGGGTGGDFNAAGDSGSGGVMYSATYCSSGGGGGNKMYPFNYGAARVTNNNGLPAQGYGCGGGGGNNGGSQSSTRLGGSGTGGLVVIWEYA